MALQIKDMFPDNIPTEFELGFIRQMADKYAYPEFATTDELIEFIHAGVDRAVEMDSLEDKTGSILVGMELSFLAYARGLSPDEILEHIVYSDMAKDTFTVKEASALTSAMRIAGYLFFERDVNEMQRAMRRDIGYALDLEDKIEDKADHEVGLLGQYLQMADKSIYDLYQTELDEIADVCEVIRGIIDETAKGIVDTQVNTKKTVESAEKAQDSLTIAAEIFRGKDRSDNDKVLKKLHGVYVATFLTYNQGVIDSDVYVDLVTPYTRIMSDAHDKFQNGMEELIKKAMSKPGGILSSINQGIAKLGLPGSVSAKVFSVNPDGHVELIDEIDDTDEEEKE